MAFAGNRNGKCKNILKVPFGWVRQIADRVFHRSARSRTAGALGPAVFGSTDLAGRNVKEYYTSPGRNWSQQKIETAGFDQESVRRVSYGRGMLYFANLDARLRASGAGTLLQALQPLFKARQEGQPLTIEAWETWLARMAGAEAVVEFRRLVLLGDQTITPAPGAFTDALRAEPTKWEFSGAVIDGYVWRAL